MSRARSPSSGGDGTFRSRRGSGTMSTFRSAGTASARAGGTRNLFFTFLISGLWHGANWTFVIWGALNGRISCCRRWTGPFREAVADRTGLRRSRVCIMRCRWSSRSCSSVSPGSSSGPTAWMTRSMWSPISSTACSALPNADGWRSTGSSCSFSCSWSISTLSSGTAALRTVRRKTARGPLVALLCARCLHAFCSAASAAQRFIYFQF